MYWAVKENGDFEIIDGQQRTVSISQFVTGDFSIKDIFSTKGARAFYNLQKDEEEKILNYKLMIYQCSGTDSEKLEWFKTINIAGAKLTDQELRNAVYSGSWVTDAKKYFSKTNCAAFGLGKDYLNGTPIRQEYLETTIKWISKDNIEEYMAKHQHESEANELWLYFQSVINWVKVVFTKHRKEMKGVPWGSLYNEFKDGKFNPSEIEKKVAQLMQDEDVTKKPGIYTYIFTNEEKHLNIRAFIDKQKREVYERQKGKCKVCEKEFKIEEMEADHITPWHEGGGNIR